MIIGPQLDALRYALCAELENIPLALDRMTNRDLQNFYSALTDLNRALRGEMKRRAVPIPERHEFSADAGHRED